MKEFFEWRWAPCVGLTTGSLTFVALSLLLIPAQFDGAPSVADASRSLTRPSAPAHQALFGASLTREVAALQRPAEDESPPRAPEVTPQPAAAPIEQAVMQRGFSPIAEREAPPPPQPAPLPPPAVDLTPAPPPAPDANTVIIQQPEPGGPSREVTNP